MGYPLSIKGIFEIKIRTNAKSNNMELQYGF